MFDQIKQLMEMKKMQEQIKSHMVSVDRQGVSLTMRGDFEVTSLQLSESLDVTTQSSVVLALMREAREKLQKVMAQTFAGALRQ
ncbi:MAG: YbaB/EbfC family nucleoid-associated protein [Candidatus Pacebacteria bacterium]|nr:YbaB/EbfC family nucleoid-associated protein [Candidatus Paceibacterota bacterium]